MFNEQFFREELVVRIARENKTEIGAVTNATPVSLSVFIDFRLWLRSAPYIRTGCAFDWRRGFTVEAVLWRIKELGGAGPALNAGGGVD